MSTEATVEIDDEIIYEKDGAKARITLNRPNRMNALNQDPGGLLDLFEEACEDAKEDDDIQVIILKGNGRAFSAGYDISAESTEERIEFDAWEWQDSMKETADLYRKALLENPVPSIAQVHGYCLAGAGELVCHADIVYAEEGTKFGYPAVRMGSLGSPGLWPQYLGIRKTRELTYTGNFMGAEEAKNQGFINRVVSEDDLEDSVEKLATHIAEMPPHVVRYNKEAINRYLKHSLGLDAWHDTSKSLYSIMYGADPEKWPRGFTDWQIHAVENGLEEALEWRDERFEEIWGDSRYHKGEE